MGELAGKQIVVTGTASGIGAALGAQLSEAGARVIGLDIAAGPHTTHQVDLGDPASIVAAANAIEGPLDGLANVAGLPGTQPTARVLAVNLLGLRALTEALSPKLRPGSAVVCVSSVTAERCAWSEARLARLLAADWAGAITLAEAGSEDGKQAYELSKQALNQWMLTACADLTALGIRINCVSPGPVDTPILPDFEASIGVERVAAAAELTGRHARPEDIAGVIAFLLSEKACWINGVVLKVDGGLHGLRAAAALAEPEEA